jgi:hypothetical protein
MGGMATLKEIAVAVLNRLGVEPTRNRIIGLVAFGAIEGGHFQNSARYNIFNTMRDMPGATQAPGLLKGIKAYPDWKTGIEATARTIAQSNMASIRNALAQDVDPKVFLHAVTRSAWCPGCNYDPFDPIALYRARADVSDGGTAVSSSGAGDFMTAWGPWILGGLALATGGALWYYHSQKSGGRGILGSLGLRETRHKVRRLPAPKKAA